MRTAPLASTTPRRVSTAPAWQEDDPPVGPCDTGEPQHRSGGCIRAGGRRRVTHVIGHPGPLLRVGSHQILPGNLVVPCLQGNRLTMTWQDQKSPARGRMAQGWLTRAAAAPSADRDLCPGR